MIAVSKPPATTQQTHRLALPLDRRVGGLISIGIAAMTGMISALLMPHGPATSSQVLLIIIGGLLIGLAAGWMMRSRWAMLMVPIAHLIAIEIVWTGVEGATTGAIRLDQSYGILALILGRGFYGLVGLLPMIFGARVGCGLNRLPMVFGFLALLGWAVLFIVPAGTPPILGADGQPLPNSVAELTTLQINGQDQALLIRGYDVDKPVLLYLSGGPGQSSLPHPRVIFENLSHDFVVVAWDQRGTGKSYAALDPTSTLTLDQAVADTIAVTNYLRERFDEPKIYLLGESWGTILGVLTIQRAPELYYAYIGSGQMVNVAETDRRIYHDLLALAEERGDTKLAAQLRAFGEPPYSDIPYANGFVMNHYEMLYQPYTPPQAYLEIGSTASIGPFGVMGSEYNLVEKVNVMRGLMDMFSVMYPQIQHLDFRHDAVRLDLPVYIMDGQAELAARRDLALEWYEQLEAPRKGLYSFENAAHAVAFEQFEEFHRIMMETIVSETYGK